MDMQLVHGTASVEGVHKTGDRLSHVFYA